jgi:hypothetical protein
VGGAAWIRFQIFGGGLLSSRLERKSFAEFLLHCNFRFRMNSLNIGPIRGVNFYDQTAILLLMILNWLVS